MLRLAATALIALVVSLSCPVSAGEPRALPDTAPASVGFSVERLQRLHSRLQQSIDEGQFSGFVTLIARNGMVVDVKTLGHRDLEAGLPMERDTIFRIYSMSKIVTSVAALMSATASTRICSGRSWRTSRERRSTRSCAIGLRVRCR
jgi:CubicO group peptidase (beta-lactamase class C family)